MSVLCLTVFMTGCVRTEYVTVIKEVATAPPKYLYVDEVKPAVPEGVPPSERLEYLLEAYASRGDALDRCSVRSGGMEDWVREIRALYPDTAVKDFSAGGGTPDEPE